MVFILRQVQYLVSEKCVSRIGCGMVPKQTRAKSFQFYGVHTDILIIDRVHVDLHLSIQRHLVEKCLYMYMSKQGSINLLLSSKYVYSMEGPV